MVANRPLGGAFRPFGGQHSAGMGKKREAVLLVGARDVDPRRINHRHTLAVTEGSSLEDGEGGNEVLERKSGSSTGALTGEGTWAGPARGSSYYVQNTMNVHGKPR